MPSGRPVGAAPLARIRALAIPPAWHEVWICPRADGHIQASGRDQRGRKQYRYHARWRSVRDDAKYGRLLDFARRLPVIRRQVAADLAVAGLSREKVLATVVRLLDTTHIRIGNDEYARSNASFGLTTMRDQHVRATSGAVRFRFRGKSGKLHEVALADPKVARVVRRCQDLPGQMLFQYRDAGKAIRRITSGDVNDYLRRVSQDDFTAKHFRTWAATVHLYETLAAVPAARTAAEAKRVVVASIREVAARLGNTPAICRRCYVHPAVIDAYGAGRVSATTAPRPRRWLSAAECCVMAMLAEATQGRRAQARAA
jgi:DNA topoisomerase-1